VVSPPRLWRPPSAADGAIALQAPSLLLLLLVVASCDQLIYIYIHIPACLPPLIQLLLYFYIVVNECACCCIVNRQRQIRAPAPCQTARQLVLWIVAEWCVCTSSHLAYSILCPPGGSEWATSDRNISLLHMYPVSACCTVVFGFSAPR